tara:strand:- start:1435 stop:1770 length:336 start_codon:yes stop_codon:yes gene_type:complete
MSFNLTKAALSPDFSNTLSRSDFNFRNATISIKGKCNNLEHPRLGYSIPKRGTKLACRRNRLKRIVKEAFRLKAHQLPFMDVIVLVQKETQDEVLKTDLDRGFSELMQFNL